MQKQKICAAQIIYCLFRVRHDFSASVIKIKKRNNTRMTNVPCRNCVL